MKHYTRFELIGPTGRITVHYGKVEADEQDGGRTLKVFVDKDHGGPEAARTMKPLLTMPDVLLACGELNKRERVAVQWVIDRYERDRSAGLTVDTSPKVHGFTDEEIAIAAECYACGPAGRLNIERAIGYEDAIRWVRDNGYLATAPGLMVDSIALVGEQPEPAGEIKVLVRFNDGTEIEAIRTCANSIYHMVTWVGLVVEHTAALTAKSRKDES